MRVDIHIIVTFVKTQTVSISVDEAEEIERTGTVPLRVHEQLNPAGAAVADATPILGKQNEQRVRADLAEHLQDPDNAPDTMMVGLRDRIPPE